MMVAMIKENIEEDGEVTITRFLNGFNQEITNVMELQHFIELEDMMHISMKVE